MGIQETPSPPHLYPQALQLKLYQAFIFSIPILFSIILFLLFYLFYLKRRASSTSPIIPRTVNQPSSSSQFNCEMGFKGKVIEKLPKVLFDEDLRTRDSQCCVCLGEFEIKDELIQIPSCKHIFHAECIHHWFRSNSTCPLCRCSVILSTKVTNKNNDNPRSSRTAEPVEPPHQTTSQDQSYINHHSLREDVAIQVDGTSSSS